MQEPRSEWKIIGKEYRVAGRPHPLLQERRHP
jgi:hypothetical protein